MPTFDELMSYSKAQTTKAESLAAELLAKRKEEEARRMKQQAEQEKRERDMQERLRKRHFEDLQKQEQRERNAQRAREAREAEAKRREDEARDRLVKGRVPGQSRSRYPSKDSDGPRRSTIDRGEVEADSTVALTRQELRERKLQLSLSRTYGNMNGRSKSTGGYVKSGRKLPGGAVDRVADNGSPGSTTARSAKERLAQMPNELRKLNTVKRDTRTIDEILQDRARAKNGQVLEGDKAKEFDSWFTQARPAKLATAVKPSSSNAPKSTLKSSSSKTVPLKSSLPSFSKSSTAKSSRPPASTVKPTKKRPRSVTPPEELDDGLFTDEDDYDDEDLPPPPSSKRRAMDPGLDSIGDTIWSLFGKSRSSYVARDVLSDDEDMEADARVLEAEERKSMQHAKQEDLRALEEERRHEEEKRRRKKMAGRS